MSLYNFFSQICRFSEFGGSIHERPVQDLAFAVARFIQKGGSFVNYYMVGFLSTNSIDKLTMKMMTTAFTLVIFLCTL